MRPDVNLAHSKKIGSGLVHASLEMGPTTPEWALAISCWPDDVAELAAHRCNPEA